LIELHFGGRKSFYEVRAGALSAVGAVAAAHGTSRRAMVVVDEGVRDTHALVVERAMRDAGFDVALAFMSAREEEKSLGTVSRLYDAMLAHRMDRASPVVAVGGGITGDTAGFAAATMLRGLPLLLVPTTLLAMVDAAIGGKTGVNVPLPGSAGGLGKNLVGAFWQPLATIADPRTLVTLPRREMRCGLAESVKHALIADPALFAFIGERCDALVAGDEQACTELIRRSATIKIGIVQRDEHEQGERALLNLGHTFAHAIESFTEFGLKHGEAVSIGLVAAVEASALLGHAPASLVHEVRLLLERIGLPVRLPRSRPTATLIERMAYDKKAQHRRIRLVLIRSIGSCMIQVVEDEALIAQAWRAVIPDDRT